ncbi:MAG: protein translocase subunit SecD, partial [Gemmatimonadota bacterium]|nr:protein translocase subunit SecD [Gemmatimonadota bacterium]
MTPSIRNRLLGIGALLALALFSLWPREVTIRALGDDGRMTDVVTQKTPLKLGLDLQGGIHLALELDESKGAVPNREDAIDRALTVIRQRIDEFGVSEPIVQKSGPDRIIVELPGERDPARAKSVVQRTAFLEFRITDMQGQFRDAIPRIDRALARAGVSAGVAEAPASPLAGLLETDTTAADSTAADSTAADSLVGGPGALSTLLFEGGVPGEYLVPEESFPRVDSLMRIPEIQREVPRGLELIWGAVPRSQGTRSYRPLYAVDRRAIITGDQLADASATLDQMSGGAIVRFQLTRAGGRVFGRETSRHIGDHMAIILDGRVQSQPPVIRSQINRDGQIELGNADLREAQDLALVLRAGALPAPLQIIEERTVGASLGDDSIRKGMTAAIVGAIAVITIVGLYYRFAGLLAVVALAVYAVFTLGGLAAFGATLTLPGLAGFVLSVGMAVDANVLIFERIREELKGNKTVRAAVDGGFQHAMPAIVDSNVTTVLTALFLFQFGTGPVKGFAVTLIVGILASFITAVFVTKTLFLIWEERKTVT